jgi:hypothetical protein
VRLASPVRALALTRSVIAELAASHPHLRVADVELIVATIFDHTAAALARGGRVVISYPLARSCAHGPAGDAVDAGQQLAQLGCPPQPSWRGLNTVL